MNNPAVSLKDLLTQAIPVPRRPRRMELGAVALDTEGEPARLVGIRYGEIDAEARCADLTLDVVAQSLEALADLDFELAVEIFASDLAEAKMACLGEGQEEFESGDAPRS